MLKKLNYCPADGGGTKFLAALNLCVSTLWRGGLHQEANAATSLAGAWWQSNCRHVNGCWVCKAAVQIYHCTRFVTHASQSTMCSKDVAYWHMGK
eukprot:3657648-Amphidinium_carterae.1